MLGYNCSVTDIKLGMEIDSFLNAPYCTVGEWNFTGTWIKECGAKNHTLIGITWQSSVTCKVITHEEFLSL